MTFPALSATRKALDTIEILEAILLQLPPQNILINQRVCTTWRDLIQTSPDLQCALFYRYSTKSDKRSNLAPTLNPLLERLFDGHYEIILLSRDDVRQYIYQLHDRLRCKHAFHIFVYQWSNSNLDFRTLEGRPWTVNPYERSVLDETKKLSDCSQLPPGSWQTMLLSDRPVPVCYGGHKYAHRRKCRRFEVTTALELVKQVAQWQADRVKFMSLAFNYDEARDHPERDWAYRSERLFGDNSDFQPEVITTYDESSDEYHSDSEDETIWR